MVEIGSTEVRLGEPVTLCYGTRYATAAELKPLGMNLAAGPGVCVRFLPVRTMKYTLSARSDDGRKDSVSFSIAVR
jgi:hypothetical protein